MASQSQTPYTIKGGLEAKKYENEDFTVIVGSEISTERGEIIGLFLGEEVKSKDVQEVVSKIKEQNGIVIIPHPFDELRHSAFHPTGEDAKFIDCIEGFNSRCVLQKYNEKVVEFAIKHNLTITAGSDAHFANEILIDLLAIQKEIHKGVFAVMDGCVCGNGAGPRTMEPFIGNVILASEDQVAIDAVAAKIMGFEPLKIDYIKMAHDRGLGMGDIGQIEIVGMDRKEFENLNFSFKVSKSPVILGDQILRKKTSNIKWLHHLLFHSPVFKTFIFASEFYHDWFWYPTIGKRRTKRFMQTDWGDLFRKYPYGEFPEYKEVKEWDPY